MPAITCLARVSRASASVAVLAVLACAAASIVHAQDQKDAAQPPATPAATDAPAQGTPAVVLDDHGIESLLGKEVTGASGDKLGRIVDVLVSKDGTLRAAVIDFGGFLGVGTRKVAVAWNTLRFEDSGPVLSMTGDELRVTPEYRTGEPVVVVGAQSAAPAQPSDRVPPTDPAPPGK